jgi:hypothetical protein
MMTWLLRNLSLLAFLLVLAILVLSALSLLPLLGNISRFATMQYGAWPIIVSVLGGFLFFAIWLLSVAVGYGLVVRFLGLCDDMAAIRRTQTGTRASLD